MLQLAAAARHRTGIGWLVAGASGLIGFVALTVMVVVTGGTDDLDQLVHAAVPTFRTTALTCVAHAITALGGFPVVVATTVVAGIVLRWRSRGWGATATLAASVAVTAATVYLVKLAVGRIRPGTDTLVGTPALDYAFPSGHTTDATVVWMVVAVLAVHAWAGRAARVGVITGCGLISLLVGVSRVYLGYHWVTDVLGGWCLATAVTCSVGFVCADTDLGPGVPDLGRDGEEGRIALPRGRRTADDHAAARR